VAPGLHRDAAAAALDPAAARDEHVATADDPWLAELAQAFGDLEGKVATPDVWKILTLSPYARTMAPCSMNCAGGGRIELQGPELTRCCGVSFRPGFSRRQRPNRNLAWLTLLIDACASNLQQPSL
jgi:hypothetical protein